MWMDTPGTLCVCVCVCVRDSYLLQLIFLWFFQRFFLQDVFPLVFSLADVGHIHLNFAIFKVGLQLLFLFLSYFDIYSWFCISVIIPVLFIKFVNL